MQRLLRLLSDRTRLRILAAVEAEELAVNEIADVLDMNQPRISNHLRLLKDADALQGRREGAWTFYRNALPTHPVGSSLWTAVREGLRDDPELAADERRRQEVLEQRRRRSRKHFAKGASGLPFEHDCFREEVLAALLPEGLVVVDAGCGDGYLTDALARRFSRVVAVDHSPERLATARRHIDGGNVTFEHGEVDDLPLHAGSVDAVFFSLVLHHVPEIGAALREARRILRPGGRVVVADLAPHQDESLRERVGDMRLGLDPVELAAALKKAGFVRMRTFRARDRLLADRRTGLELFIATGERSGRAKPRTRS